MDGQEEQSPNFAFLHLYQLGQVWIGEEEGGAGGGQQEDREVGWPPVTLSVLLTSVNVVTIVVLTSIIASITLWISVITMSSDSRFSRQSRFMRSMTPSGSVKMSTSRFNLVCGKTVEQAVRPNLDRIPNPQPPKIIDSRVLTPSLSRKERGRSQERTNYGRPPVAPTPPSRDSSLYIPFGSYAEKGIHARPGR